MLDYIKARIVEGTSEKGIVEIVIMECYRKVRLYLVDNSYCFRSVW